MKFSSVLILIVLGNIAAIRITEKQPNSSSSSSTTKLYSSDLVQKGGLCYRPGPDFSNGEKKCAPGLECRFEAGKERLIGAGKICLESNSSRGYDIKTALVAVGGLCYRPTPEFSGGEKKCAEGLACRHEAGTETLMGASKFCIEDNSSS